MRTARLLSRLAVVVGASLTVVGLVSGTAFAVHHPNPNPQPSLTRTVAKFKIPKQDNHYVWTMTLFTCSVTDSTCRTKLLGTQAAESGTLVLTVPPEADCTYQANIERAKHFFSGRRITFSPCGAAVTTSTTSKTTSTSKPSTTGTSGGGSVTTGGGGGGSTGTTGTAGGHQPNQPNWVPCLHGRRRHARCPCRSRSSVVASGLGDPLVYAPTAACSFVLELRPPSGSLS